jgi:hypothetical protein
LVQARQGRGLCACGEGEPVAGRDRGTDAEPGDGAQYCAGEGEIAAGDGGIAAGEGDCRGDAEIAAGASAEIAGGGRGERDAGCPTAEPCTTGGL